MKHRSLFSSHILERERLNHPTSSKWTYHLKLDLTHSGITYKPGDAIAIMPSNPPSMVEHVLDSMNKTGIETVLHPTTQTTLPLKEFLAHHSNLIRITSKTLTLFPELAHLNAQERKNERKHFIDTHDIPALFEKYGAPNTALNSLIPTLAPILPRFYSITSSQRETPSSVDLLVVTFQSEQGGKVRGGLSSDFICKTAEVGTTSIPLYHHPNPRFKIPERSHLPLLMIGPGTGVAPYRSFLKERVLQKASGKHWLFFGERHRERDFYYEPFFRDLVDKGVLRLDCAFSRDQKEKVYVQHLMWKNRAEIWEWINKEAVIYICGDARYMARAVTDILEQIVKQEGRMSKEKTATFMREMRKGNRLLLDVY